MALLLRIAMRDWDHLTPLLLGEIADPRIDLRIERVQTLPGVPSETDGFDVAEVSLSRFVQQRLAGHTADSGIANFPMRAFRHRCIITRRDHPARRLEDLRGARIGVTGWQDSGNTWTRDALVAAGVPIDQVRWFAGRLTAEHPIVDRLGPFAQPGWIDPVPGERPMLDLLLSGELDAVFTPFMPAGFFSPDSAFRPVLDDIVGAEAEYYRARGFVPGIHALAIRADLASDHPWLAESVSDLMDQSSAVWSAKRQRYAETTPWLFDDLLRTGRLLRPGWDASGLAANATMIQSFMDAAHAQGLIARRAHPGDVFPADRAEEREERRA
ncbi:substrate-binding domain-containing protein [Roseitranquillus sediminis]|uniref:nitrate ABC transporter substrate-binding protein n=1 Tax=Roseitranquillus sediminis TaxID=2809051 RepID=UPI001D0C8A4C|nr:nitrate ABC transporter substrate-binding protein [Roseitranquillus sediminis]MBM9594934.1 nitrate ABC transporter substrate-binding protein [Roseitranquillus sediminis]